MLIPELRDLSGKKQIRIIPSTYPPINFFENLVAPDEMEILWKIESLTNDRILEEVGELHLVKPEDRVSGEGASVVMAAFTHIHYPSRFTDGSYGVYYAGLNLETAVHETVYHRERFFSATQESACEISMRVYEGVIEKPLHDVRTKQYTALHHPHVYTESQLFGRELRATDSYGILYNSVRHAGGLCIAAFKPRAVSIPKVNAHLRYIWNGKRIIEVYDAKMILQF